MIIQEIKILNGRQFTHTYSSENKYIEQVETGAIYNEAYDVIGVKYTYTETNESLAPEDIMED